LSSATPDVINTLAEEKVLRRIFDLETIFECAMGDFKGIYLSRKILRHSVVSYFRDLDRMKDFHKINFADQHKRAAFTMLWIVRTHPVQLHTDANMSEALLVINEYFAVHAGIAHLNITPSDISKKYLRNLVYNLHFRPVSGELLTSLCYLLECSGNQEKP